MTCEACIKDIEGSLFKLGGIQKVEANLKDQLVTIEGTSKFVTLPRQENGEDLGDGDSLLT